MNVIGDFRPGDTVYVNMAHGTTYAFTNWEVYKDGVRVEPEIQQQDVDTFGGYRGTTMWFTSDSTPDNYTYNIFGWDSLFSTVEYTISMKAVESVNAIRISNEENVLPQIIAQIATLVQDIKQWMIK